MAGANLFAWMALFMWPVLALVFYRLLSLPVALCTTIIGGYLLLPERISVDLPILPALNKHTIPALCALVLTALSVRQPSQKWPVQLGWLPEGLIVRGLMGLLLIGTFGTTMTNGNALHYGERVLPGLKLYDAFSLTLELAMMLIPFVLGRKVLASSEGQKLLLIALVISAAAYAFLALYEVRMSPQLNSMVYGFFPHSWHQHVRGNGFRPLVFLNHGLWLGLYLALAVVAAAGLLRIEKTKERSIWMLAGMWLLGTLFLAKSLGPLMITFGLLPIVFLFPKRSQVLAAAAIATIVLAYPVVRTTNLVPLNEIISFAAKVDSGRAQSFQYRLDHEDILLAKAQEKPIFGWGGWGRNRVYSDSGGDISTTDGFWIITLGLGGWLRYIGVFGLLSLGTLALLRQRANALHGPNAILTLIMAASLVDLIPNATITPITWLIAGALAGCLEQNVTANSVASNGVTAMGRSTDIVLARTFSQADTLSRQEHLTFRRPMPTPNPASQSDTTPERRSRVSEPKYRREFPKQNRLHDKKR